MPASALVAFEYLLTFKDEFKYVISRKWHGLTWLLVASRYELVFSAIQYAVPYTSAVSSAIWLNQINNSKLIR